MYLFYWFNFILPHFTKPENMLRPNSEKVTRDSTTVDENKSQLLLKQKNLRIT